MAEPALLELAGKMPDPRDQIAPRPISPRGCGDPAAPQLAAPRMTGLGPICRECGLRDGELAVLEEVPAEVRARPAHRWLCYPCYVRKYGP